jgi:hypothetical protein
MTNGEKVINSNIYPDDTLITVSHINSASFTGKQTLEELNFPFIHETNGDSTMYFKITIIDDKIYKLVLSTGMRIMN